MQMRRLCIIVLSVLLLYAGVARALGACPVDWSKSDQNGTLHATHRTTLEEPGFSGNRPPGSSSVIHCPRINLQIGPIIESSRVGTSGLSNHGIPLQESVASGAGILLNGAMHYHTKFSSHRPPSISFPATSSFYVFLSVFQI